MSKFAQSIEKKIVSWADVAQVADRCRREGGKLVTTNGCFDLLHWGHMRYLADSRGLGDKLWVGVNGDDSLRALKGTGRPIHSASVRALQLASLEAVSYVTIFEQETPVEWLKLVRPAIHTKGGDYEGKVVPESAVLATWGGAFQTVALESGFSTTSLIDRIGRIYKLS